MNRNDIQLNSPRICRRRPCQLRTLSVVLLTLVIFTYEITAEAVNKPGLSNDRLTVVLKEDEQHCNPVESVSPWAEPQSLKGEVISDCRSIFRKITDRTLSITREIWFRTSILPDTTGIISRDYQVDPAKRYKYKKDSRGLYMLIHGLKGHPGVFTSYGDRLVEEQPGFDVVAPFVPQKGDCALKVASEPLLNMVRDYTRQHPGRPVSLIAISNGARIADYIENAMREYDTAMHVTTLAGAHAGSEAVNTFSFFFSDELVKELDYYSKTNTEQLKNQRKPLPPDLRRSFLFGVSTEDTHIWPYTSSLPVLRKGEQYFLVHAEGHTSIVDRSEDYIMARVMVWMNKESGPPPVKTEPAVRQTAAVENQQQPNSP